MESGIYVLLLALLLGANIGVYRQELSALLPEGSLRKRRQQLADELMMMRLRRKRNTLEKELFASCVTLRNLALVKREAPVSADYIYERLMENGGRLKPLYSRMLTLYRTGHDREAFALVGQEIGTRAGRNFALILSKLERLEPAQMAEQMEMFAESLSEAAMTAAMKKAQRAGVIITALGAASVFALLVNFTVVVIFLRTVDLLSGVFA